MLHLAVAVKFWFLGLILLNVQTSKKAYNLFTKEIQRRMKMTASVDKLCNEDKKKKNRNHDLCMCNYFCTGLP